MPRGRVRGQQAMFPPNVLYCGDNLEVLGLYIEAETIDLIYLDPPFKKHPNYNMLFRELSGRKAAAQVKAWAATWIWDQEAINTYREVVERGGRLADAMQAFYRFLGDSQMMAYLTMMAPRLVELRRVLKPTGTVYLHCDPAASHYLKMLMDAIFGPANFLNEIVWCYDTGGRSTRHFPRKHETIFRYSKEPDKAAFYYDQVALPRDFRTMHEVILTDEEGRQYQRNIKGGKEYRYYADKGVLPNDWWTDIQALNPSAKERKGYPTQKPERLLERIIKASTVVDDVVLDPFCGCGSTIVAAEELRRRWIGIDITYKAIDVIRDDLDARESRPEYVVRYEPVSEEDAQRLADEKDKSKFEEWAVRRVGGVHSGRRGADQGIDGRIYFHDEPGGETRQVVISVKAGATGPRHVRELDSVVRRERADIGVLVTMREPTLAMRREASGAGNYVSVYWDERYPRLQLLTVRQLMGGEGVRYPRGDRVPGLWQVQEPIPEPSAEERASQRARARVIEE